MEKLISLTWRDRRGGHLEVFRDAEEAVRKLKKLKCEATLRIGDEEVGGVEDWADSVDDRRVRWVWWYDAEALGLPSGEKP